MKETMAKTINDVLSGNISKHKIDEEVKQRMDEETKNLNKVIKPEYLKNSVMEKVSVSIPVWFIFLIRNTM